jgi:hypothetical protein
MRVSCVRVPTKSLFVIANNGTYYSRSGGRSAAYTVITRHVVPWDVATILAISCNRIAGSSVQRE